MKQRDENKDIRTFGIGLTIILLTVGSYHVYRGHYTVITTGLYAAAGITLFLSLFATLVFRPVYKVLTAVGYRVGMINTKILLGIVFYLFITPVAFIFKIAGRDPLDRKMEENRDSYWTLRKQSSADKKRHERQF